MTKFIFSALACVAFAFSGFASNEVVEMKGFLKDLILEVNNEKNELDPVYTKVICNVSIAKTDWLGREYTIVESQTYWFVSELIGNLRCDVFASQMEKKHGVSPYQPPRISPY